MANSKRKCALKTCGLRFRPEDGIVRGLQAWCGQDHQIEWAMAAGKKLRERTVKQARVQEVKQFKAGDRPLQVRLTQAEFNRMIRLLDAKQGCISCDKPPSWKGQWHAGHFKTTAAAPALRFDARNCFKQCSQCNNFSSGNLLPYKQRLVDTYGIGLINWLEGPHELVKLSAQDLAAMRKQLSEECRRLEAGLPPNRDWRHL